MSGVRLASWGPGDLELLERLVGDPEMMAHLGGPESPQKIRERQQRYESSETGVFKIVENAPSNAICRKLGFELPEALEFEYPRGHFMRCNDWRLRLGH